LMGALACSFLPVSGAAQSADELDENIRFLAPLMGHLWEGGFVGEHSGDLVISLRFEPVLAGKAVRYTREVASLDYVSETHFFWSPVREEVLYLALNSRGIVGEGVVSMQDGAIVLLGVDQWPEQSVESRTVLELDEDGILRDTFFRKDGGEWVRGHVQEFTVRAGETDPVRCTVHE
ncbi:MAG: hypothetical protein PVJ76_16375, partial [Gemmatimonadota bacterium]